MRLTQAQWPPAAITGHGQAELRRTTDASISYSPSVQGKMKRLEHDYALYYLSLCIFRFECTSAVVLLAISDTKSSSTRIPGRTCSQLVTFLRLAQ